MTLAPSVTTVETDISDRVPSVAGVDMYIQIRARKGPKGPRVVSSETDLLDTYTPYGRVLIGYDLAYFSAITALKSTNKLLVNRVVPADAKLSGVVVSDASTLSVTGREVGDGFPFAAGEILLITSADEGEWGNDFAIKIFNYSDYPRVVKEENAFVIQVFNKSNLNTPVEQHLCSLNPGHLDGHNRNIYVENVLENSAFIRGVVNPVHDYDASPYVMNVGEDTQVPIDPQDLSQGYNTVAGVPAPLTDGDDGTPVTSGEMIQALDATKNRHSYPITLLLDGGYTTPAYQMALVDIAHYRKDCVAVLSMPFEAQTTTDYINDMIAYREGNLELYGGNFNVDSSYAAMYAPHIKTYDKFNDYTFWASPDGYAAAVISNTERTSEIWYPAAGFRRGKINAMDVYHRFTDGEMGALYDANINIIRYAQGQGLVLWGQKTLQSRPSALDRLNVRLMLITIQPAIQTALDSFVFEINDDRTRSIVQALLSNYMEGIKARRGVSDFYIVCDETNNTPENIDNYEMNVWVFVKATKAAEYIKVNTVITRSGISFDAASQAI